MKTLLLLTLVLLPNLALAACPFIGNQSRFCDSSPAWQTNAPQRPVPIWKQRLMQQQQNQNNSPLPQGVGNVPYRWHGATTTLNQQVDQRIGNAYYHSQ